MVGRFGVVAIAGLAACACPDADNCTYHTQIDFTGQQDRFPPHLALAIDSDGGFALDCEVTISGPSGRGTIDADCGPDVVVGAAAVAMSLVTLEDGLVALRLSLGALFESDDGNAQTLRVRLHDADTDASHVDAEVVPDYETEELVPDGAPDRCAQDCEQAVIELAIPDAT